MVQEETASTVLGVNLSDKVADKIIERIEDEGNKKGKKIKPKHFKLPSRARRGVKRKLANNHVLVFLLRSNNTLGVEFLPIENEMIYLKNNQTYHLASSDSVFLYQYKKLTYPAIILPEWSMVPLDLKNVRNIVNNNGLDADGQQVAIKAINMAELKPSKKLGGNQLILIVLGGLAALYFVTQAIGK